MKKKLWFKSAGALALAITVLSSVAYAGHGPREFRGGKDFGGMLFGKAHMILENRAELGLPDEKVEAVRNLMLETKKAMIKQKAEIEITDLDLKAKLIHDPADAKTVNTLIDQKYELKKAKAKILADALAKLSGVLTKEQNEKLKTLCEAKMKQRFSGKHCFGKSKKG